MDTYEVTEPTEKQVEWLQKHFKVEQIDSKTYNVLIPDRQIDSFVEWADKRNVYYRLL